MRKEGNPMIIADIATDINNTAEKLRALSDLIACAFSDAEPRAESMSWVAEIMMEYSKSINEESNSITSEAFMIGNRERAEQNDDTEAAG